MTASTPDGFGRGRPRDLPSAPATSNGHGARPGVLDLAPEPKNEDEVVDAEGAQVFLDPAIVPSLQGKVLDAHVEGEQLEFAVLDDHHD